jgi:hypothetical protein
MTPTKAVAWFERQISSEITLPLAFSGTCVPLKPGVEEAEM